MFSCRLLLPLAVGCWLPCAVAQTGPTATPQEAPKTAPQVEKILPSYEGQHVTTVELAGQPGIAADSLQQFLYQKPDQPFHQADVDRSVAALQQGGHFQSAEVEIRPEADGIRVLFVLHPAMYFGLFDFPGAVRRFAYSRLLQIADYPPRGAYTSVDIANAQRALEIFFRRNGYFQAAVTPRANIDKLHGLVNVSFETKLGKHAKFGQVNIKGPDAQQTEQLQKALRSWMARIRNSAIRPGKGYSLKVLQNASLYLEDQVMKREYLGAKVQLIGANYDPATNRADIDFNVQPGAKIKVKVEGAHVWSWTKKKLLPIYQQNGLDPELLQEGRQNLISHFQSKGYFEAKVALDRQQTPEAELVHYQITKGPRHKVAGVEIAGNDHLSTDDLMPHIAVEKAHFFSHGKYSEKLVRSSVKNLKSVYQANGFSDVKITPQIKGAGENISVVFQVQEGEQDVVDSLVLKGNDSQPIAHLAPKGLNLGVGKPYSTKLVDDDRNQIMAQYLREGYLNSSFRETANQIGKDKHHLAVVYQIYEGPQVQTASVFAIGRQQTQPYLIAKTTELGQGDKLREDKLLESESKLYNLGVFDWAEIDPRRQVTTQTQEDVVVKVHEAKRNQLTYGFGFEVTNRGGSVPGGTVALPGLPPTGLPSKFKTSQKTFWGPRATIEYTRKNLFGNAITFTASALGARLDQRGTLNLADPYFRGSDWASNFSISGEHNSENPIFTSRQGDVGFQLQRALNDDRTQNLFLRYSLKETGLTQLLIPDLVPTEDRHIRLSTFSSTYVRDTRDNILDAHKGIYETAEVDMTPSVLGSSVSFAKFIGQVAYYKKMFSNVVWANSVRLGVEQPFAGSHVPLSEKFFSGGGSTIRGFPLNGAGPQRTIPACGDPADTSTCSFIRVPTGGNELFIVNSEFRIPLPIKKGLGLAAFYDGGNVFPSAGFHDFAANYTNTVGIGLRYATPVGPVRVDIGHNLNALPGIKATQFFITLGQAF
jgi:outer membrane protein insertion porin family